MSHRVPESLNVDPRQAVFVDSAGLPWTPSPMSGVERRFLEREGGEVARATSIVRYAPGSAFSAHVHEKGEEYLVLAGVFSDERGDFAAGTYVRNPPGSGHTPFTREGCTIFVKLRQMADDDDDAVVVRPDEATFAATEIPGLERLGLHRRTGETVTIERLAPGTLWEAPRRLGGEEILVLAGTLLYGGRSCPAQTWIRIPDGQEATLASSSGCRLWTKRGHLAPESLRLP